MARWEGQNARKGARARWRNRLDKPLQDDWCASSSAYPASAMVPQISSNSTTVPDSCEAKLSPNSDGETVYVVWHKCTDLRVLDHEPLVRAHSRAAADARGRVLHLHLLETELLVGKSRVAALPRCGARRAKFWREAVEDVARQLEEMGQALLVCTDGVGGCPGQFFRKLAAQIPIVGVFAHREFCDEEIRTEKQVRDALSMHGAFLDVSWGGLTVHHIDDLGFNPADDQEMPPFKGQFFGAVRHRPVRHPVAAPKQFSPPPSLLCRLEGFIGSQRVSDCFESIRGDVLEWAPPPPDIGLSWGVDWIGGETCALRYLRHAVWESDRVKNYVGATESFNQGTDINPVMSGTRLSPWLSFGCVSARTVIHEVRKFERAKGKSGSTQRLYKEFIFRDFLRFLTLTWRTNLFKLEGPFGAHQPGGLGLKWSRDKALFERWRQGRTGYPFVDAGMRELAATGYMSHLHRQCCAAFLVRDLKLDWRMGAEHFEETLLDYTPDANWGNWAYRILQRPGLAASMLNSKIEHVATMEVIAWPVVHDARMEHTLAWVPELRALPKDIAREPWRLESHALQRVKVKPYRDSPLWFCAANRGQGSWQNEYYWLQDYAWTVAAESPGNSKAARVRQCKDVHIRGIEYPRPLVPPLNLEVDLDVVPVDHAWGDTPVSERPHIWGRPGKFNGHISVFQRSGASGLSSVDMLGPHNADSSGGAFESDRVGETISVDERQENVVNGRARKGRWVAKEIKTCTGGETTMGKADSDALVGA